jgi:NTP pyrophosphatase (non-canonical NTP hydrolase)/phosphopantetheinyl transferase (holo-ACP synthase)
VLVSDYNTFVQQSDQSAGRSDDERRDIALFGLVGEIGSLLSAIKKQILSEAGIESWDDANDEIIEELGDVIWYSFFFARVHNKNNSFNILTKNIALLKKSIGANNIRSRKIYAALDENKRKQFLEAAETFPDTNGMSFDDYQKLAFLTARTQGKILLEVCLVALWQLGSELLKKKLPSVELSLIKQSIERDPNVVLGDIAWHLASIASVYKLSLSDIARRNELKVSFRLGDDTPTPLHDELCEPDESFPFLMELAFLTVNKGRSRMYLNGTQLGDDLTDNYFEDDGYRFHDVMHLANIAKLGWSPVLRSLLKCRRVRDHRINEVEDGARAKIVEEAIVKAIHAEGVRIAKTRKSKKEGQIIPLFANKDDITFKFLKFINTFVAGLEVQKNKYWEWAQAITDGYKVFYELCKEEQGTVTVDLKRRSIEFRPDVYVDIKGTVVGIGSALLDINLILNDSKFNVKDFLTDRESVIYQPNNMASLEDLGRVLAVKHAIFDAIAAPELEESGLRYLDVHLLDKRRASVKAHGHVQEAIWKRNIVSFKTTLTESNRIISCVALAMSDPGSSAK